MHGLEVPCCTLPYIYNFKCEELSEFLVSLLSFCMAVYPSIGHGLWYRFLWAPMLLHVLVQSQILDDHLETTYTNVNIEGTSYSQRKFN